MNESYTPKNGDFEFLTDRNIEIDKNFTPIMSRSQTLDKKENTYRIV